MRKAGTAVFVILLALIWGGSAFLLNSVWDSSASTSSTATTYAQSSIPILKANIPLQHEPDSLRSAVSSNTGSMNWAQDFDRAARSEEQEHWPSRIKQASVLGVRLGDFIPHPPRKAKQNNRKSRRNNRSGFSRRELDRVSTFSELNSERPAYDHDHGSGVHEHNALGGSLDISGHKHAPRAEDSMKQAMSGIKVRGLDMDNFDMNAILNMTREMQYRSEQSGGPLLISPEEALNIAFKTGLLPAESSSASPVR